jgi:predicted GIY-YIG superfamily endonuclease
MFYVYILKCADGSYYTGMTDDLERRLAQHHAGTFEDGYTATRRPVERVWSEQFPTHDDAFRRERQIKGWSRAKKEALIRGDWEALQRISRASKGKSKADIEKAP